LTDGRKDATAYYNKKRGSIREMAKVSKVNNVPYYFLMVIFIVSILSAVILVYFSVTYPFSRLPTNETIGTAQIKEGVYSSLLKDILPVATALIGFAAGLASGVFGVKVKQEEG
jgi:uncharacterized membrane protein YfcA